MCGVCVVCVHVKWVSGCEGVWVAWGQGAPCGLAVECMWIDVVCFPISVVSIWYMVHVCTFKGKVW